MEMLEDILIDETVMTEITPQKYWFRRHETLPMSDDFIKIRNEIISKRNGEDRFIREGYMTIEEGRVLLHALVDERRKQLKQNAKAY